MISESSVDGYNNLEENNSIMYTKKYKIKLRGEQYAKSGNSNYRSSNY